MVEGEEDDRLIEDMSLSLFVDEIKVKSFFFFLQNLEKMGLEDLREMTRMYEEGDAEKSGFRCGRR